MSKCEKKYLINNKPINIYNFHIYLTYLNQLGVIPDFYINIFDDEIHFTTIYSKYKWAEYGTSKIIYNIYTKKWKSIIDHKNYITLIKNFNYLNTYNMIQINFDDPYIEYILESDYYEDILEPSLNIFDTKYVNNFNINIYDLNTNFVHIYLHPFFNINENKDNHNNFLKKVYACEAYLMFNNIKLILTAANYILPPELWNHIYSYYKIF